MDLIDTQSRLQRIFGRASSGTTADERARSSTEEFVRSQDQLAFATPEATGSRLSAKQAYEAFGLGKLEEVADYGAAVLVSDPAEPAATIRGRREALGLTIKDVASFTGLKPACVEQAERRDKNNRIGDLERIARALGLDEARLTTNPGADGDGQLASRLRAMMRDRRPNFGPQVVLKLADAAWVTHRQSTLSDWLSGPSRTAHPSFEPDSRYGDASYPAWRFGYDLANHTRRVLGIAADQPVYLRRLVEYDLKIPLISLELPRQIAGATIAGGRARGIAINTAWANKNVWIRRSTIAHELGHLLWDPDQNFNSLCVDSFEDVSADPSDRRDYVEARANAFAIEFLAPQEQATRIFQAAATVKAGVRSVMEFFGISFTSARYQIWNGLDRSVPFDTLATDDLEPTADWTGRENFALDIFKPASVPPSRRGLFAGIVVKAMRQRLISVDSAAAFLDCSRSELERDAGFIEDLFEL